jgi:predicted TIM-barrel fold metal-dependent hydrolase
LDSGSSEAAVFHGNERTPAHRRRYDDAVAATASASGLDIVDAHHHLIDVERLAYPWIGSREAKLEALLANYYDIARDYSFDDYRAQIAPSAHELIASFPETTFVLEAAGWPVDLGDDGFASWTERLEAVSSFPNVAIKLQGVALIFGTTRELVEPWVATAVRIFGPTRAMFATHWPVDHLLWDIGTLVSTLRAILGDLTFEQEAEFLAGTARGLRVGRAGRWRSLPLTGRAFLHISASRIANGYRCRGTARPKQNTTT